MDSSYLLLLWLERVFDVLLVVEEGDIFICDGIISKEEGNDSFFKELL